MDSDRGLLEGALDTLEDIFVVFDVSGRLLRWNRSAEKITGYRGEEAARMNITDFFDRSERGLVAATIKTGIDTGYASVEMGLLCKDGRRIPFEFYGTPIVDDDGLTVAVTAIGRNITIRRELEARERDVAVANAQREAAEKYLSELRDLVTIASHELRHPAAVFKGYARLLMNYREQFDESSIDEALHAIDASADRLAYLVEELFETALIEQEELELELARTVPSSVVSGALERIRMQEADDFLCDIHPPAGEEREIEIDPRNAREVLVILLENAAKFSPDGEKVELWFEQDSSSTTFFVADRGPGIPVEHSKRIFERFYQVEGVQHHSTPGLGLGLYVARRLVEAQNGRLEYVPRQGGGSLFSFMIPTARPDGRTCQR